MHGCQSFQNHKFQRTCVDEAMSSLPGSSKTAVQVGFACVTPTPILGPIAIVGWEN